MEWIAQGIQMIFGGVLLLLCLCLDILTFFGVLYWVKFSRYAVLINTIKMPRYGFSTRDIWQVRRWYFFNHKKFKAFDNNISIGMPSRNAYEKIKEG